MKEKQVFYVNGFLGIIGILILAAIGVFFLVQEIFIGAALTIILAAVLATGIGIVQPNQAKVITFFGNYLGTIRQNGVEPPSRKSGRGDGTDHCDHAA